MQEQYNIHTKSGSVYHAKGLEFSAMPGQILADQRTVAIRFTPRNGPTRGEVTYIPFSDVELISERAS